MKKVNIIARRKSKVSREIGLGNGQRIAFSSNREAARFVAQTNKYLTKVLLVLNDTYISIWIEYRRFWPIACNMSSGTRSNSLQLETDIKKALESADFMLSKFTTPTWGSNDPYFAFIDLRKVCLFLKDAADNLAAFHKKRDHTGNYYTCSLLSDRCLSIMSRLDAWKYEGQKKIPR